MKVKKNQVVDCPGLHKKIEGLLQGIDGVAPKLISAGLAPSVIYSLTKASKKAVEYWQLDRYLRALGSSPEALGVAFEPEPQKLLPIASAPVGVPVLGVWLHVSGDDFCSVILTAEGHWLDTNMATDDREAALLTPPDGYLELPVVEAKE